MAVRDYIEATSEDSPRRISLLLKVEAIIHELGYEWETLPADNWLEVYKRLTGLSPQVLKQYDGLIRSYYVWLSKETKRDISLSPYRPLEPEQISEIYAYHSLRKYVSTVEDLISMADNLQDTRRITAKAKLLNKACLAFIWSGLQVSDILELKEDDVAFFDENDSLLTAPKDPLKINKLSLIKHSAEDGEHICYIANKKCIQLIHELWSEAHEYRLSKNLKEVPLLIAEGAGKRTGEKIVLSIRSMNVRINRTITAINEANDLSLSIASIRLSALYHTAYAHWKLYKMPWYFTPQNSEILLKLLKRDTSLPLFLQKVEFQQFIEYVANIKKDPMT